MALASLAAVGLHQLLPSSFRVGPHWVYPVIIIGFLVVLVIGDPGRLNRRAPWLRITTGLMIALITLVNSVSAVRLVINILANNNFETARQLLATGAIIWGTNIIAFALWFWDLDRGGAAARAAGSTEFRPAMIFPEMEMPELVEAGWYPQLVDYLALSFNTATAFGPTDVSAVKPWSKVLMMAESSVSLILAALVIARAVNVL